MDSALAGLIRAGIGALAGLLGSVLTNYSHGVTRYLEKRQGKPFRR